jgi:hypothetical protein
MPVPVRVRALLVIVVGAALHGLNRLLATGLVMDHPVWYPMLTLVGWVLIAIGVCGLVHGISVTDQKPGRLVNAYALGGVAVALVHMYFRGMFHDIARLFR